MPPPIGKSRDPKFGKLAVLIAVLIAVLVTGLFILRFYHKKTASETTVAETATLTQDTSVEDYYKANPDFFQFSSTDQIPADLNWENGMHLPEFSSSKATKGGSIREGLSHFPRTLRFVGPDTNRGFKEYMLKTSMQYAHLHPNVDGYYPGIAQEWAIDKANNRVFIRIHPEARWSDGVKITSDDAVYAFYFYQSPHIQSPLHNNQYANWYKNITRYDEYTFSIKTTVTKADLAGNVLQLAPVPRHYFHVLSEDFIKKHQWEFTPTCGAYDILKKNIKKGRSLTLTRIDNWWAKDMRFWRYRFNIDNITFQVIRNTAKQIEAFHRGDLDICGLNQSVNWYERIPNDAPVVQNGYIEKVVFYNDVPRPPIGIWINTQKPLLNNRLIRTGISYACNWDLAIEQFFRGDYERLKTTSDGYGTMSHPSLKAREFSAQQAIRQFERAGFSYRDYDGILTNKDGERLSFTVTAGFDMFGDLLAILKQEAVKAGLELRIEILDITTGWKKIQEKNYQLALTTLFYEPGHYPHYEEVFHSRYASKPQTNNISGLNSTLIDKLIDTYQNSEDFEQMRPLAHRIEELIHEEAVFVPGYMQPFYRYGHWRWVSYPEGYNVRRSQYPNEYFIHWIDEAKKAETLKAKADGKGFPPSIKVFDQYRLD